MISQLIAVREGPMFVLLAHVNPPLFPISPTTAPFLRSTPATPVSWLLLKHAGLASVPGPLHSLGQLSRKIFYPDICMVLIFFGSLVKVTFLANTSLVLCPKLHLPRQVTLPSSALLFSLVITTCYYMAHFTSLSYLLSVSPTRMKAPWVSVLFSILLLLYAQCLFFF